MSSQNEPILNLDHDHRAEKNGTRVCGDITVIFTWLLSTSRPVMVLVPTGASLTHDRVIPSCVPLEMAYLWDEHIGDGAHCAATSYNFAGNLGFNPNNPQTLIRITSIIREHLGDLLKMPQQPDFERRVMAEITSTDTETGKTIEAEIMGDV